MKTSQQVFQNGQPIDAKHLHLLNVMFAMTTFLLNVRALLEPKALRAQPAYSLIPSVNHTESGYMKNSSPYQFSQE